MPGRNGGAETYRYGFIGKENDNEVNNITGGSQDHKFRQYDPRLGRYKSLDPLARKYAWNSPYAYAENRVIEGFDIEGLEFIRGQIITDVKNKGEQVLKTTDNDFLQGSVVALQVVKGLHNSTAAGTAEQIENTVVSMYADVKSGMSTQELVSKYQIGKHPETVLVEGLVGLAGKALEGDPEAIGEIGGIIAHLFIPAKFARGKVAVETKLTAAEQLKINKVNGAAFEAEVGAELSKTDVVVDQITLKTKSGTKTRVDFISQNKATGKISITEAKSSGTASLTKGQKTAFPEIATSGATVVGKGKGAFTGGVEISATKVNIVRPK